MEVEVKSCFLGVLQVHVGWMEDGTAVFAFRGTATVQDGLADVKIMRLDVSYLRELFPGARAHLGTPPPLSPKGFTGHRRALCGPFKPDDINLIAQTKNDQPSR